MPEPTPEAWAQIRHDYENTDKPLAHICAEHGITVPMLRYRMKVWEWTRRKPLVPRQGPPPALPSVIPGRGPQAANPESITPAAAYGFRARRCAASRNDMESENLPTREVFAPAQTADPPPPGEGEEIVPRLQGAVARVLPAIEATIARLAAGAHHPREMEQAGRTLSSLTRTLRELNALLAEHNARPGGTCDCCDMPEDMDAFREELAQQIETFLASRADEDFEQPEAGG